MSTVSTETVELMYVDSNATAELFTEHIEAVVTEPVTVHEPDPETALQDACSALSLDCVVARMTSPTDETLFEAIQSLDTDLPLVMFGTDLGEEQAATAYENGADDVVLFQESQPGLRTLAYHVRTVIDRASQRATLQRHRSMLDSLFEDLPVFLFFKDDAARYTRVSEAAYQHEQYIGKTTMEFFPNQAVARQLYEEDMHILDTGEPVIDSKHEMFHPLSMQDTHISVSKVPWRDASGEIVGIAGIMYNITDQVRKKRKLERQNERLEEFASVLSHDLRNPLNIAQGHIDLVEETGDVERASAVDSALERMEELIEDLLALAREGQSVTETESIPLAELVDSAWQSVDSGDATLRTDVPATVSIEGDSGRVRQLFENLLRNAIDHVGTEVTIQVGMTETGFFVEDDGPGIPAPDRSKILEHGYTTSQQGTGLGLSIVRSIAGAHGWEVSITDGDLGGARFELTGVERQEGPRTSGRERKVVLSSPEDIGPVDTPGDTHRSTASNAVTVSGSGRNIWEQQNEFHFVYTERAGDFDLRTRLRQFDWEVDGSKAGLMIRDRLEEHSAHAFVGQRNDREAEALWAAYTADNTADERISEGIDIPQWYELRRREDTITAAMSPDGDAFVDVWQREIPMDESVHAGLAVCSAVPDRTVTAEFDNLAGIEKWDHCDIGQPNVPGTAQVPETRVLSTAGDGIDGSADAVHLASGYLDGDGTIQARLCSLSTTESDASGTPTRAESGTAPTDDGVDCDGVDSIARAGVMIRGSSEADAATASLSVRADEALELLARERESASTTRSGDLMDSETPTWLKLERQGTEITASVAVGSRDWQECGRVTLEAAGGVSIGVFVGGSPETDCTGEFDHIEAVSFE